MRNSWMERMERIWKMSFMRTREERTSKPVNLFLPNGGTREKISGAIVCTVLKQLKLRQNTKTKHFDEKTVLY